MSKNVLVTGAAGFLGSHLVKKHLDLGDSVWGADDFSSSSPTSKHLTELEKHEKFSFIPSSINESPFRRWGYGKKFDLIYNFACPASPPIYQSMPLHTMMTCVAGTANVLELAQHSKAIVVHASTSEVYGDPPSSPQDEEYFGNVNSYGPRSCYDEGKRAAEALCYDYLNSYEVDARLVRIFNTYGPNMDPHDGRVVTNFIKQALAGQKLTIYGDGMQTRSFCYVDDLIDGIYRMGQLRENPKTPINLGNPGEFTMKDLASAVIQLVHGPGHFFDHSDNELYERRPLPQDDPMQRRPDITLARELLGWEPKVDLVQGLGRMIDYMKGLKEDV